MSPLSPIWNVTGSILQVVLNSLVFTGAEGYQAVGFAPVFVRYAPDLESKVHTTAVIPLLNYIPSASY